MVRKGLNLADDFCQKLPLHVTFVDSRNSNVMVKGPLAHIVNDGVIVNVCTKRLPTDVDRANKEGKEK